MMEGYQHKFIFCNDFLVIYKYSPTHFQTCNKKKGYQISPRASRDQIFDRFVLTS